MSETKRKNSPHPVVYVAVAVVGILIVLYLVFDTPSFFVIQANMGQPTVTLTQTETTSTYSTLTTTSASVNTATVTSTEFQTVTNQPPSNVVIDGIAKSDGLGTTATDVIFTDSASNAVFRSQVDANGHYVFSPGVPNQRTYLVQIGYSGTPLSGKCDVKLWTIDSLSTQITANLHC